MIAMQQTGFIFDYSKCVGCHACLVGCFNENKTEPPITWRQVNNSNPKKIPLAGFVNLSIACNHCEDAPCLRHCPAKAYKRDEITGAVIHQPEKCIGCKYCTWACPFDAPKYNPQRGIVEKCHLCTHRVEKGLKPACAVQCPTGALAFGAIDKTKIFGIPETKFSPRINTLNSSVVNNIPEMDSNVSGYDKKHGCLEDTPNDKIHAIEEWPLVLFTSIYAFLSGWIFAFINSESSLYRYLFIGFGVVGMILSAFHLGKPFRATRSIFNIRSSWLSREILLSGLFLTSAFVYLFVLKSAILLIVTASISVLLLLSIEMVYSIAEKKYFTIIHSANTVLTALLFALLFASIYKLFVAVLVIKALLYLSRKKELEGLNKSYLALVRFLIGILIPLAMVLYQNPFAIELVLTFIIIGELIDRFEFYDDIYINSPRRVLLKK